MHKLISFTCTEINGICKTLLMFSVTVLQFQIQRTWNILFVYVIWQKQFVRREVEISCSQMWISSRNTASSLYKCTSFIHDSTDRDLWITQAVYTFMYTYISTKIIKFCTEKKLWKKIHTIQSIKNTIFNANKTARLLQVTHQDLENLNWEC